MKVFHSLEEYRNHTASSRDLFSAVTLGKFDGIHIGHMKLIRDITRRALSHGEASIVFAIEMKDGLILSHEERAVFLDSQGVDILIECPFSREFRNLLPDEFVRAVVSDTLHARYAAVGTDFTFGRGRSGDAAALKVLCAQHDCRAVIQEKVQVDGEDVSSSRIRDALRLGDMELVCRLLGRPYPILGTVSHGRHIGTGIGIPTVNLIPKKDKILPPDGVYASVTTLSDGTQKRGLTNIGIRPTVGGKTRRAETTLFDFHSEIYGQRISHELIRFIRPERKFSGLDELKSQIESDKRAAWG